MLGKANLFNLIKLIEESELAGGFVMRKVAKSVPLQAELNLVPGCLN
jgi:hypothetical protein